MELKEELGQTCSTVAKMPLGVPTLYTGMPHLSPGSTFNYSLLLMHTEGQHGMLRQWHCRPPRGKIQTGFWVPAFSLDSPGYGKKLRNEPIDRISISLCPLNDIILKFILLQRKKKDDDEGKSMHAKEVHAWFFS